MADEAGQIVNEELDAEREARRRIALAQIRQYSDPVLRMQAREVESFDDDLSRLVERMTYLVGEANGVGLAANQVGVVRRVFVFRRGEDIPKHTDEILEKKPKAVWFQLGIRNDAVAEKLAGAGIMVVQDLCLMVEHRALVR